MVAAPAPRRSINLSYPLNPRVLLSIFRSTMMHTTHYFRLFWFVSNKCNQGTCGQRTKKNTFTLRRETMLLPLPVAACFSTTACWLCDETQLPICLLWVKPGGKRETTHRSQISHGNLIHVEQGLHRILLNSLQPYNVRKQKYKCFPTAHLSCSPPRGKRHKAPKPKRN